jgi:integrase
VATRSTATAWSSDSQSVRPGSGPASSEVATPGGGRKKQYSKAFSTETQARTYRNKVERDELSGLTTDYRGGSQLFSEYVETWLKTRLVKGRPLAPTTMREYRGLLRRNILPTFESAQLRAITTARVRSWLAETVERAGPDQAAKSYRVLRAVMSTAAADELVARNTCQIRGAGIWEAAERPMIHTSVVLQLADALIAVDDTNDKTGSTRPRALALMAGFAGLRPGELLALRRDDIDPLHHTVTVDENAPEGSSVRVLGPPKSEAGRRTVAIPAAIMRKIRGQSRALCRSGTRCLGLHRPTRWSTTPELHLTAMAAGACESS